MLATQDTNSRPYTATLTALVPTPLPPAKFAPTSLGHGVQPMMAMSSSGQLAPK